jgi:hypothetical protein
VGQFWTPIPAIGGSLLHADLQLLDLLVLFLSIIIDVYKFIYTIDDFFIKRGRAGGFFEIGSSVMSSKMKVNVIS